MRMSKFLRMLATCLCCLTVVIVPFMKNPIRKSYGKNGYSSIIEMWQIDGFEGGQKSRSAFLKTVANEFSDKNGSVVFMVTSHTVESANNQLSSGKIPDIISFGGYGLEDFSHFRKLDKIPVYGNGELNGKNYLTAWLKGGYFFITRDKNQTYNENTTLYIGSGNNNLGVVSATFLNQKFKNIIVKEQNETVKNFLGTNNSVMVGTQRDIIRLEKSNVNFYAEPIGEFNDLYAYIGVTAKTDEKYAYSVEFIKYLLSNGVQKRLTELKMFSVNNSDLYESGSVFSSFEKTKEKYTAYPTMGENDIKTHLDRCITVLKGEQSSSIVTKYLKQL